MLRRDWQRFLRSRNLAGSTQRIYDTAARQFVDWLAEHNPVTEPAEIGKRDIEGFIEHVVTTRTASTANVTYRALQQWFKWMLAEEEIERSPMERTTPPIVPEKPVPVLSVEQLRELLDQCKGRELLPLRDTAIIRLLLDTGGWAGEVAGLRVADLDLDADVAHVVGTGRRPRALPFGDKTGTALARYLRARARDKHAERPELWLAEKGKGGPERFIALVVLDTVPA